MSDRTVNVFLKLTKLISAPRLLKISCREFFNNRKPLSENCPGSSVSSQTKGEIRFVFTSIRISSEDFWGGKLSVTFAGYKFFTSFNLAR